jgi:uncharacterized membrane protein
MKRSFFFLSLALNIFLLAFLAGRPGHHSMPPEGMLKPPPPFLRPESVFSAEELAELDQFAQPRFAAMQQLRETFAAQLESDTLPPDALPAYFAATDSIMNELRDHMQEAMSAKLATLPAQARADMAQQLRVQHPHPPHEKAPCPQEK